MPGTNTTGSGITHCFNFLTWPTVAESWNVIFSVNLGTPAAARSMEIGLDSKVVPGIKLLLDRFAVVEVNFPLMVAVIFIG